MIYKKFIVFSFPEYYPSGGMGDVTAEYDNLEEAKNHFKKINNVSDFNYVIDRDTWECVYDLDED